MYQTLETLCTETILPVRTRQGLPEPTKKPTRLESMLSEFRTDSQDDFSQAINEYILAYTGKDENNKRSGYKWSSAKEDSSGTDGFIGCIPVTIKPNTCDLKKFPGVKRINYTINKERTALSFTFSI